MSTVFSIIYQRKSWGVPVYLLSKHNKYIKQLFVVYRHYQLLHRLAEIYGTYITVVLAALSTLLQLAFWNFTGLK